MSLGEFGFKKKHTKANVNFLFDRNLKGIVHYYDVIEGIYLRNMDFLNNSSFLQNSPIYTPISVADL